MVYLDLDELPGLVGKRGLLSTDKYSVRSFFRTDHLFEDTSLLSDEIRDIIRKQTGTSTVGPIRLLTQLRQFGYYMSPLNLFYAFDASGQHVEHVVAEVNNTPWGERHCYLLGDENRKNLRGTPRFAHQKEFHVSPFMGMDMEYHWSLSAPGLELLVRIANSRGTQRVLDVDMKLQRRALSKQGLRRMTFRYPAMTAQIAAAIYYQALKLWWKRCPFYTHPNKQSPARQHTRASKEPTTNVR